jgi:hypothetical protein
VLTIDATDPKSGTAEFKASAIRVDRAGGPGAQGASANARAVAPWKKP